MIRILTFFLAIFTCFMTFSKDHYTYLEFPYVIKKNESLFKVLNKVFLPGLKHTIKAKHVRNIITRNPQIKSWKNLRPGQTIIITAKEDLINKKEMLKNIKAEQNRRKDYLEKSTLENIELAQDHSHFKLHYNRTTYDAIEVLPESIESSFETFLGLGLEYILYFNKDIFPLRIDALARWNYYKKINFISSTNPDRIFTKVKIPSTWDFSLSLAKEKMWNNLGLNLMLESNTLYNVEFSAFLDRNLLRTNENIWIDIGLEYPVIFQSLKFKLSTALGRPMLIKTYLTDLIGEQEFTEDESKIELSGIRQHFSGEVYYKDYFFSLSYINSKYSKDKDITFKEIKSRIGVKF